MKLENDKSLEKITNIKTNNGTTTSTINNNIDSKNNIGFGNEKTEEVNFDSIFTNEDNIKGFDVSAEDLDSVAKLNEIYENSNIEVI